MKALLVLFNGFEELEAVSTIDLLRRGKVDVTTVAIGGQQEVTGSHNLTLLADTAQIPEELYDALIIPGGPGVLALRHHATVENLIQQYYNNQRIVAAICAAPILLSDLGLLKNHQYTAHFSMLRELPEAQSQERVVVDGKLITGSGPAAGMHFGLAILQALSNLEVVREVAHALTGEWLLDK